MAAESHTLQVARYKVTIKDLIGDFKLPVGIFEAENEARAIIAARNKYKNTFSICDKFGSHYEVIATKVREKG